MVDVGSLLRLDGRTALITGSTRGIGRAIAETLAAAGAAVCVMARKAHEVEETVAVLRAAGLRATGYVGSVGDDEAVRGSVAHCMNELGGLHIVVNNAATNPLFGPMVEADPVGVAKTWLINQQGPLRLVQEAWTAWMSSHGGVVLNIGSVGGLRPTPMIGVYNVSKAALLHMTRQLAIELAPTVRVNAVAPGLIKTGFSRALYESDEAGAAARQPLGRLGLPDDVAAAALYLCSDAASWVTGHVLVVDGGGSLTWPA